LADDFIQSDYQIEAVKPTKGQQYVLCQVPVSLDLQRRFTPITSEWEKLPYEVLSLQFKFNLSSNINV